MLERTAISNPAMTLTLCLSYGGRQEIVDTAKRVAEKVRDGQWRLEDVDERLFSSQLYQPDIPDPDLMIRTGGEYRISNFLLWQLAYSEFVVLDRFWPEFTPAVLHEAFLKFGQRLRRFGKTSEQVQNPAANR